MKLEDLFSPKTPESTDLTGHPLFEPAYNLESSQKDPFKAQDKRLEQYLARKDSAEDRVPELPVITIENHQITAPKSIEEAREALISKLRPHGQKERFLNLTETFEKRAKKDSISPDDVAKTYQQIGKLLSSDRTAILSIDKARVAEEILYNCAHPESIAQGMFQTCGATSIENRIYRKSPSVAAELVTDMAISLSHTTAIGERIKLSPTLLVKDSNSKDITGSDGMRSYASQIFQSAAIETWLKHSDYSYKIEKSQIGKGNLDREYLVNEKNGERTPFHGMTLLDMSYIEFQLTGQTDKTTYLGHSKQYTSDPTDLINEFDSVEDLETKLRHLKNSDLLPASLFILGGEGFSTGPHFVTIVDYDPESKMVSVDNSSFEETDRIEKKAIELDRLYKITHETFKTSPLRNAPPTVDEVDESGAVG